MTPAASKIGEGAVALDKTLNERTKRFGHDGGGGARARQIAEGPHEAFAGLIGQGAISLDKYAEGTHRGADQPRFPGAAALDKTLKERTEALTQSIAQGDGRSTGRSATIARRLLQRSTIRPRRSTRRSTNVPHQLRSAINQGAISLDRTLADRSESLHQRARPAQQGRRDCHRPADRGHGQAPAERTQMCHRVAHRALQSIDSHLRPARRRNREGARRACAHRRGDVRPAGDAAQRAARQQLGHDPADRGTGRSTVEGSHRRARRRRPRPCATCRAGCSSRSTA